MEAAGAGLCEQLVTQKGVLNGLLGMRKDSDAKAAGSRQREREGNRWINCGSPIDLQGMRPEPIRQLAGAPGTRAGLRQTDRCAAHF